MDENRLTGSTRNLGGKIEEKAGNLVGDAKTQAQGKLDQAAGAARRNSGQLFIYHPRWKGLRVEHDPATWARYNILTHDRPEGAVAD
jgi:uncharacterized protein YjbJ (UPF0337 family)